MKKALLSTFLSLALAALLAPAAGAQTPPTAGQASGVTVIQNATILTVTQGTIQNGSILIRNGKIARVGRRVRCRPWLPGGLAAHPARGCRWVQQDLALPWGRLGLKGQAHSIWRSL